MLWKSLGVTGKEGELFGVSEKVCNAMLMNTLSAIPWKCRLGRFQGLDSGTGGFREFRCSYRPCM